MGVACGVLLSCPQSCPPRFWRPQNSYRSAACAIRARSFRRYQQAYRRRLDQSKARAVRNVAVLPEAKIFGDLEIDGRIGL